MNLDKINMFFSNFLKAIGASELTYKKGMELVRILNLFDPYGLTTYEVSFKVKDKKTIPEMRFLNMDSDGYSCRNKKFYLKRVKLFEGILKKKCENKNVEKIISALRSLRGTPMDLYFGADIKDDDYLFAFWFIFGGIKRSGDINFWKYNFEEIINKLLRISGLEKSKLLTKDILNFGFDIGKDYIRYKIYYLCRKKTIENSIFTKLVNDLNSKLQGFKYFYFHSEMYDEKGDYVKEKLYIEFLEDIMNGDEKTIGSILDNLSKIKGLNLDVDETSLMLKKCGGRISLIGFEPDGAITFYIRPD